MKFTAAPVRVALLLMILFALAACDRAALPAMGPDDTHDQNQVTEATEPTAEDLLIARHAIDVSEIRLMLGGGFSQAAIISEVKQRHLRQKVDAFAELELTNRGASPALIAALKDPENQLTRIQMASYRESAAKSFPEQRGSNRPLSTGANSASSEQEKERARQLDLQQQGFRLSEQRRAEQAAQERKQNQEVEATWRGIAGQNSSHGTHGRTISSSGGYYDSNGRFIPYHR